MIHQMFVSAGPPDLPGSAMWAIREWGIWLFLTPVAFRILRQYGAIPNKRIPAFIQMGVGVFMVSLTFRIGLDVVTGAREALASLVIFFPRHLAALAVVVLVWYLFLRTRPASGDGDTTPDETNEQQYPATLLVNKGHDECLIRVDRIQCISAAGNYLEICCDNRLYLIRATMKQIEELLPPAAFIRTHRSHIVNISEIDRHRLQRYRLQAA